MNNSEFELGKNDRTLIKLRSRHERTIFPSSENVYGNTTKALWGHRISIVKKKISIFLAPQEGVRPAKRRLYSP
ncbi:hypothetical protein SBA2_260021 [Acidobacteriia bacterium SbA2]|nr:hypothetical protein SBA2_260021 [Acidobacteriia bacterium SbA2]